MTIAHVVVDIPVDGHFDYVVPDALAQKVSVGSRVKVSFGTKPAVGIVIGLAGSSDVKTLKPIKDVFEPVPMLDNRDLAFAQDFCRYYGVSLGQTLTMMLRHRRRPPPQEPKLPQPKITVYHCPDGVYWPVIDALVRGRTDAAIIVPDAAVANQLGVPKHLRRCVGLRSSMFEAFAQGTLIVVVDEDNPSFKQEQSPMYETRQVMLMASRVYGFELVFVGASPSVELMQLALDQEADFKYVPPKAATAVKVIDTGQYKFLDKGILSPPVRNMLEANQKAGAQSILLLNRRGTFNVTRCGACGHVLKCPHCDAAMAYARSKKNFSCRHCTFQVAAAGACPACHAQQWKSFGLGVEGVQRELALLFPQGRIAYFDKDSESCPKTFDILIATQAIVRCKGMVAAQTLIWVDFDAELNRMDMRSSFKAWAQVLHLRSMAAQVMVQTQNPQHHVLKALRTDDAPAFYRDELDLRRELHFSPFYHWAAVVIRSRDKKNAQQTGQDVYNQCCRLRPGDAIQVQAVVPDTPAKLRDQYRFKVMVGGAQVEGIVAVIKTALAAIKKTKAIITINIDP